MSETRAKSAKKPEDHKPAADEQVEFEFEGVTAKIYADAFEDQEVLRNLRNGLFLDVVEQILEAKDARAIVDAVREKDARGRVMSEHFGPFFEAAQEAVGSKNS
ncbi:hypothetical protein [Leucobacter japonicus]|uniref:hypothetical protein n=1 Tax=Leucobacter japonicus TaxID=1461259 RepID=UPI0006A7A0D3|nr:hypothetical protein [Leucobacter japonicus]